MEKKTKPKTETINVYHLIGAIALGIAIVCLFTGSFLWTLILGIVGYAGLKKGHERFEEAFEREYRKLLAEQDQKPDPDEEDTSVPAEAPNEESPVQDPEPVRAEVPAPDEQKKKKPCYKRWWFWAIAIILLLGSCGQSAEEAEPATEPTTDILATLDAAEVLENASIETAAELIRTVIEESGHDGYDGYDVTYSDNLICVDFWGYNILSCLDSALNGDASAVAKWNEIVLSQENLSASYSNFVKTMGLTDVSVAISIRNAVNFENYLLTTVNGKTTYNYLDVVESDNIKREEAMESASTGEENALKKANSYLNYSAFSRTGLIDQLEYEGFTTTEATFAVDNCGADWNEQALKKAKSYLDFTAFSRKGLIGQLEYEGFTTDQATQAVDNCGANWNEQAAKKAKSYLEYSAFSRSGLIDQLKYEGFTENQAEYGARQNGY